MRKIVTFICFSILLTACNDGDVFTVELNFEDVLTLCPEITESYLVYKTKPDPFESLSIIFPQNATNNLIFNPTVSPYDSELTINMSSIRFNYRTYDGDPINLICTLIPGSDVNIIEDFEADSGTIQTLSTFIDSDDDGIPSEFEDINGNGNLDDDDTDNDGIPNYLDEDDDNDNVLTKNENPDPNNDGDFSDAQNTNQDEDSIPDYLDNDDDGDGVLTRLEDENMDTNPTNDFDENSDTPNIRRYLDNTAVESFAGNDQFLVNTYDRIITVDFKILNTNLEVFSAEIIELGTYTKLILDFNID